MKITIYELLGRVKDGKAPKKVRYRYGCLYKDFKFDGETSNYISGKDFLFGEDITAMLNDKVEILEEEKKIPEKITINENGTIGFPNGQWTARNMDKAFAMKINEIIDYFEYLKSKGDE